MEYSYKYMYRVDQGGKLLAAYSQYRVSRPPENGFIWSLAPTLRLLRVLQGEAQWKIGRRQIRIVPGDIIVVNNVEPRCFVSVSGNLIIEIFSFLPSSFGRSAECLRLFYNRSETFSPRIDRTLPCFRQIGALMDMLLDALASEDTLGKERLCESLLVSAFTMLLRDISRRCPDAFRTQEPGRGEPAVIIAETVRWINDHFSEEFGVEDLASRVNLSRG